MGRQTLWKRESRPFLGQVVTYDAKMAPAYSFAIAPLPWAKWEHLVNVGKSCFKLCVKLRSKLHTFVRCCWRPILPRFQRCYLSTGQVDLESVSVKGTHLNIISRELSQLNSYFLYNVNAVLIFRGFLCVCCWVFLVLFLVFFVGFVCLFLNKYS